jgi:hypothetical protein
VAAAVTDGKYPLGQWPIHCTEVSKNGRDWSLVGSSGSVGAGGHLWIVRRRVCINSKRVAHAEASRPKDLLAKRIAHREQLYSDFMSENARAMVDAMQHTLEDPADSRRFTRSLVEVG